jgi:hypothetical protein
MKKALAILLISGFFAACNSGSESGTKETVDSLEARKDTLTHNVDSSTKAKVDSIESHGKELKAKYDSSIDAKKDSVKGKSSK